MDLWAVKYASHSGMGSSRSLARYGYPSEQAVLGKPKGTILDTLGDLVIDVFQAFLYPFNVLARAGRGHRQSILLRSQATGVW